MSELHEQKMISPTECARRQRYSVLGIECNVTMKANALKVKEVVVIGSEITAEYFCAFSSNFYPLGFVK